MLGGLLATLFGLIFIMPWMVISGIIICFLGVALLGIDCPSPFDGAAMAISKIENDDGLKR